MDDKTKLLYDAVSKDYDVGTFDEFQSKLADPEKRKAFYDGVGQEYQLGTFDEFNSKIDNGVKKKAPMSNSQIGGGNTPTSGYESETLSTSSNQTPPTNFVQKDALKNAPEYHDHTLTKQNLAGFFDNNISEEGNVNKELPQWHNSFDPETNKVAKQIQGGIEQADVVHKQASEKILNNQKTQENIINQINNPNTPQDVKEQLAMQYKDIELQNVQNNVVATKAKLQSVQLNNDKQHLLTAQQNVDDQIYNMGVHPLDAMGTFVTSVYNGVIPAVAKSVGTITKLIGEAPIANGLPSLSDISNDVNQAGVGYLQKEIEKEQDPAKKAQLQKAQTEYAKLQPVTDVIGDKLKEFGNDMTASGSVYHPEKHELAQSVGGLVGTIAQIGLGTKELDLGAKGAQVITAITFGADGANNAYDEATKAGLKGQDRTNYTLASGLINGSMAYLPAGKFIESVAGEKLASSMMKETLDKVVKGNLTGDAIFDAAKETIKDKGLDIAKETGKSLVEAGVFGLAQGTADYAKKKVANKVLGRDAFEAQPQDIINTAKEMMTGIGIVSLFTHTLGKVGSSDAALYDKVVSLGNNPNEAKKFNELLDAKVKAGDITPEQAMQVGGTFKAIQEADKSIPATITDKAKRIEAINLIAERNSLAKENLALQETKKTLDPAFNDVHDKDISENDAKIDKINSDLKLIANGAERTEMKRKDLTPTTEIATPEVAKETVPPTSEQVVADKVEETPLVSPETPKVEEAKVETPEVVKPEINYKGQHKIIRDEESTTTLDDMTKGGRIAPDDFYTHTHFYYDRNDKASRESVEKIKATKGKPEATITIYRSVPKGIEKINEGDWVSLSPTYAKEHGRHHEDKKLDMPVIKMKVKVKDVIWDGNDVNEFAYFPKDKAETPETKPTEVVSETPKANKLSDDDIIASFTNHTKGNTISYTKIEDVLSKNKNPNLDGLTADDVVKAFGDKIKVTGKPDGESGKVEVKKETEPFDGKDYTKGKTSQEIADEKGLQLNEHEHLRHIAEESQNPMELATEYLKLNTETAPKQVMAEAFHDHNVTLRNDEFDRYFDKNNKNYTTAKQFIRKDGVPLDNKLKELSEIYGVEMTPQDFVDYIRQQQYKQFSPKEIPIRTKFKNRFAELTDGKDLTPRFARQIIEAQLKKENKDYEKYINQEFKSRAEAESEYYKQIANGTINIEGYENVSNDVGNKQGEKGQGSTSKVKPTETAQLGEQKVIPEQKQEKLSAKELRDKRVQEVLQARKERKANEQNLKDLGRSDIKQGGLLSDEDFKDFKAIAKAHLDYLGDVTKASIKSAIDYAKETLGITDLHDDDLGKVNSELEGKDFGMSHNKIDAEREEMKLPPIIKTMFDKNEEIGRHAMEEVQSSPELPSIIADDIIDAGQGAEISLRKQAILALGRVSVHHELGKVIDAINEARAKGQPQAIIDGLLKAKEGYEVARDKYDKALNVAGSIWGKFGNFRQMIADEKYSFKSVERDFEASVGRKMTSAEKKEFETIIADLKKVNEDKDAEIKKLQEKALKKKSDKTISDAETEHKASPKRKAEADKIRSEYKKKVKDWDVSIYESAKSDMVAERVAKGREKGQSIDTTIDKLVEEGQIKKENAPRIKKDFHDLLGEKSKEELTKDALDAHKEGGIESKKFRDATKELAKTYFGQGLTADEITSKVANDLGLEQKDIQKAISGYGIPVMTKKAIDTEMQNLKSASQIAIKIEKLKNDEPITKSVQKAKNDEITKLQEQYKGEILKKKITEAEKGYEKKEKQAKKEEAQQIKDLKKQLDNIRKANRMSMEARNDRFIENAKKRIEKLQEMLDTGNFDVKAEQPPPLTMSDASKALDLKERQLQSKIDKKIRDERDANKPRLQKIGQAITDYYRSAKLVAFGVYGKLFSYDLATAITKSLENVSATIDQERFPKLYDKSVVEKASTAKELWDDYYKHFADKETRTAIKQKLQNLTSDFEHEFGDQLEKQFGKNWIGQTHLAVKMPLLIAETKLAYSKLLRDARDNGMNPDNEFDQQQMKEFAVAQGYDAILMGDNKVSEGIRWLKNLGDKEGASGLEATVSFLTKFLIPIDKIPNNFVLRSVQYSPFGLLKGEMMAHKAEYGKPSPEMVASGINDLYRAVDGLSQEDATKIAKLLKRGKIGTAAYALGALLMYAWGDDKKKHIGGYYYEGNVRGKNDKEYGQVGSVPAKLGHNFIFNAINLLATGWYSAEKYINQKEHTNPANGKHSEVKHTVSIIEKAKSVTRGMINSALALGEEAPVGNMLLRAPAAMKEGDAKFLYGIINPVPGASKELADFQDWLTDNKIKYDRNSLIDDFTYRVAFLRQKYTKHAKKQK